MAVRLARTQSGVNSTAPAGETEPPSEGASNPGSGIAGCTPTGLGGGPGTLLTSEALDSPSFWFVLARSMKLIVPSLFPNF